MTGMDQPQRRERPLLITIICMLALPGTAAVLRYLFFARGAMGWRAWFPFYIWPHAALVLVASIALWKMKRWGVYLYILSIVEGQAVMLILGVWGILSLVLCSGLLAVLLYYLPEME
jgi:uncharacterized membrane protein (DUF2068 family)